MVRNVAIRELMASVIIIFHLIVTKDRICPLPLPIRLLKIYAFSSCRNSLRQKIIALTKAMEGPKTEVLHSS